MLEDDPEGTSMRKFFHPLWKDKQQRGCGEKRAKKKEGGPPIPRRMTWTCASRPIFDIRDKTKQGIFSKVYIFSLDETSCFLSPLGGDPREDFSLFYRRNLWKKYLDSFFFRRYHAFSLLIVILCSSKNQYSEGSLFPWLSTPLWTCQSSVSLCVCVHGQCHASWKSSPCFDVRTTANYFPVADTPRASKRLCQGSETP